MSDENEKVVREKRADNLSNAMEMNCDLMADAYNERGAPVGERIKNFSTCVRSASILANMQKANFKFAQQLGIDPASTPDTMLLKFEKQPQS